MGMVETMTKMQRAVDAIMEGMKQERRVELSFRPEDGHEEPDIVTLSHEHLQKKYGAGRYLIAMDVTPRMVGRTEIKTTTPLVGQITLVISNKGLTSADKVKRIAEIIAAFESSADAHLLDTYDR